MKRNNLSEIKKMDTKSIRERVDKIRMEILEIKVSGNSGKTTNTKDVKNKRRDLAQMLTVLRQKHLLENLEAQNG